MLEEVATNENHTRFTPSTIDGYEVIYQEILKDTDKFTMVANRVAMSRMLNFKLKTTYMVLKQFCYDKNFCFPTEEYLGFILNCDVKTVRAYIDKLCELKLIAKQTFENGIKQTKAFYLLLPPSEWLIEQEGATKEAWDIICYEYKAIEEGKRAFTQEKTVA